MAITASLVKELREKTGAGMMDCKKALEACDGDIEKSFDWLREKGIAKAAKKADRIAAEGLTAFVLDGDTAAIDCSICFRCKTVKFKQCITPNYLYAPSNNNIVRSQPRYAHHHKEPKLGRRHSMG